MTTIEVTDDRIKATDIGQKFDVTRVEPSAWNPDGAWRVNNHPVFKDFVLYNNEVLVLPPPRHLSFYDPNHPGELEPDAYDRMSYKYDDHGRHLLHTGIE